MMIGGLRLVTRGESSRHGDVSRELAVLEPPPLAGDWTPPDAPLPPPVEQTTPDSLSEEISNDKPRAEALLTTPRDRWGLLETWPKSRVLSDELVSCLESTKKLNKCQKGSNNYWIVTYPLCSSSMEMENRGRISFEWIVRRFR